MRETRALRAERGRPRMPASGGASEAARAQSDDPHAAQRGRARRKPPQQAAAQPPQPPARALATTPLPRREARRIARDPEAIDARMDLHGMRQREAYPALKSFLRVAQARGYRMVLVITGKGAARDRASGESEPWDATPFYEASRGVLRRLVPEWLAKPEFREVVAGVSPAHPRDGGDGALYVRLRRPPSVHPPR